MTAEKIELNSLRMLVGGNLNGRDVLDKIERLGKMNLEEQKILAGTTQRVIDSVEHTIVDPPLVDF